MDSTVTDTRLIVPQSTTVGVSRTFKVLEQPPVPPHSELGHSSTRTWNTLTCRKDWSWMEREKESTYQADCHVTVKAQGKILVELLSLQAQQAS